MTKELLILLLKGYKENKASLKLKLREKEKILRKLEEIKEVELKSNITEINGDIHSKNSISDKVGNVASNNIELEADLNKKLNTVEEDINEISSNIEEVDIRLESLKYKEKQVIIAYYIEGCTYEDIGNRVYLNLFNQTRSARNIQNIVDKATEKMAKI